MRSDSNITDIIQGTEDIMSNKYKQGDSVPNLVLADRLDELATAITKGADTINREFTMRVPAEFDRDADLVMSQAAKRLREFELMMQEQAEEFADTEYDVGN